MIDTMGELRLRAVLVAAVGSVVAGVLWGPFAAPVRAASVHVVKDCSSRWGCSLSLWFVAQQGEVNHVLMGPSREVTIIDSGAPLIAQAGCTQFDDHTATCVGDQPFGSIRAYLGDGADTFDASSLSYPSISVRGGGGSDQIVTGPDVDEVFGGSGADSIQTGASGDYVHDGPGDDRIATGPGADALTLGSGSNIADAGTGFDTAVFDQRAPNLHIDLRSEEQQPFHGHTNTLRSIEGVETVSPHAVLLGTDGPNHLQGGPHSLLRGFAGNDLLSIHGKSQPSCGEGSDHVYFDRSAATIIRPSCEHIYVGNGDFIYLTDHPSDRGPFVEFRPHFCLLPSSSVSTEPCELRLEARLGTLHGRLLGKSYHAIPANHQLDGLAELALNPYGRRLVERRHAVRATISETYSHWVGIGPAVRRGFTTWLYG